jgi:multidrug resistance efflux pump
MIAGLLVVVIYSFVIWLVFFKFRWLKFSIAWGVVSVLFGAHLLLIFLVGLRFVTPYSTDARMIQHTIQLVPRLPEPTLVTAVLVENDTPVKKDQPLFEFDRRPYEYKVRQLEAQLAHSKQNVLVLLADVDVAAQNVAKARSDLEYAKYQQQLAQGLAAKGAGPEEDVQKWTAQAQAAQASVKQALAEDKRASLKYQSQIGGVNTTVAAMLAELEQARYYLDNTTLVAPEDGRIVNLQVRPGMVSGDWRIGAIASLICDADRYLLATYNQESLKYVKRGQPVEVALDLYPGQIYKGKVAAIWRASGRGQLLPSGNLPQFAAPPPEAIQGRFAVAISLDDEDQSKFPIGAQGAAAIYTSGGGFAALRRIVIRAYSWFNWLYPIPS